MTGYEKQMYNDINLMRKALEAIADHLSAIRAVLKEANQ